MSCVGVVCVSGHLKEQLAWARDKQIWAINNAMLFKTVIAHSTKELKNKTILNLKQYCMHCYTIYEKTSMEENFHVFNAK